MLLVDGGMKAELKQINGEQGKTMGGVKIVKKQEDDYWREDENTRKHDSTFSIVWAKIVGAESKREKQDGGAVWYEVSEESTGDRADAQD